MKNSLPTSRTVFGMTPHFGSSSWNTMLTVRRMSASEKL